MQIMHQRRPINQPQHQEMLLRWRLHRTTMIRTIQIVLCQKNRQPTTTLKSLRFMLKSIILKRYSTKVMVHHNNQQWQIVYPHRMHINCIITVHRLYPTIKIININRQHRLNSNRICNMAAIHPAIIQCELVIRGLVLYWTIAVVMVHLVIAIH